MDSFLNANDNLIRLNRTPNPSNMLLAFSSLACCDAFETLHHYTEHNLDLKLLGFVVNVCNYHVVDFLSPSICAFATLFDTLPLADCLAVIALSETER